MGETQKLTEPFVTRLWFKTNKQTKSWLKGKRDHNHKQQILGQFNVCDKENMFDFTISSTVVETCAGCLQPCSILLHNYTGDCRNKHKYFHFRGSELDHHRNNIGVSLHITKITKHIPIYLKGFPSLLSWFRHCSITVVVHWFTLLCW